KRAVEIDPPFPKAFGKLGSVLVDNKQYDDAEPYLIQAIRKDPKNAINYWYLGKAYAALHKNRQAIDNYELYLKYAPKTDADREKAKEIINQLKGKEVPQRPKERLVSCRKLAIVKILRDLHPLSLTLRPPRV